MAVRASLEVDLDGLRLPSPIAVASGCFGTGRELESMVEAGSIGAVVSRSITLSARKGAPSPRLAETPSGLLSHVGLQNPGVDAFVADDLLRMASMGLPVIASVAGGSVDEFVRVTARLDGAPGVVALEIYLASADEEIDGRPFFARPERAAEVAGAVARRSPVPVFAKLPAMSLGLVDVAGACVRAGAHGLTLVDGVPAMGVDARALRPQLGGVTGFLSGPAVHPLAMHAVYEAAQALPHVPIFGVGGVFDGEGAVELLLAGAWAVQMGTAVLVDPASPARVARGIASYLQGRGMRGPAELRGRLHAPAPDVQP